MDRLAGLAGVAALAAIACSSNQPGSFGSDGGGTPAALTTLTIGFSGTGSGTVNISSDGVAPDASSATAACSAACIERYPSTATVNLTASAAGDSNFDGWDPSTSDPSCGTPISMASNVTCTALFDRATGVSDAGAADGASD